MTVTRDVIRDLWPLYESGEATTDTCALVERYLDDDAELARELSSQRGLKTLLAYPLPPDLDREMLAKARRRLWRSDWLHRLTVAAFFAFVVLGRLPGGFEGAIGWIARRSATPPPVTGYRTLADGRRIEVMALEQRLPGDPLVLHYFSAASGCALDSEAEQAFAALGPEAAESRTREVAINAYRRSGAHVLDVRFEREGLSAPWQRTAGGIEGCPATEAAIVRSKHPQRYREWLKVRRSSEKEEKR